MKEKRQINNIQYDVALEKIKLGETIALHKNSRVKAKLKLVSEFFINETSYIVACSMWNVKTKKLEDSTWLTATDCEAYLKLLVGRGYNITLDTL